MTGMSEMRLPDAEDFVLTYPSNYLRIWKILWTVDPARIKIKDPETRAALGKTILAHGIAVSQAMVALHTADFQALQATQKQLGL